MRTLIENRTLLSLAVSCSIGIDLYRRFPFPVEHPRWLTIPDRGLYTGIAVFRAIGSGKTSCCMHPFAEQIFAYKAAVAERRASALVLEVKGDFCYKVAALLNKLGREADYVEVGLAGRYRYNPLHNDLEAYALAYGIASLLNNLFGKGKEPFWQQAYTNLVEFIILLHKVNYDYVTLFDVYECAINPEVLESRIREGERLFESEEYVLVSETDYVARRDLAEFPFQKDAPINEMKSPVSVDLLRHLDANRVPYSLLAATAPDASAGYDAALSRKREQLAAVKRWFYHDWRRIEPKLRTSIVEGICVPSERSSNRIFSGSCSIAFPAWNRSPTACDATSCSCAANTKASPQSARAIPPATRSSSLPPGKPNASRSSRRKV